MSRVKWEWVSPVDDSVTVLTGFEDGIETPKGVAGHGAPALARVQQQVPGMPGARTRSRRHEVGEVQVPVFVRGDSVLDLENRVRTLVRRLDGLQGDGILRRTSIDGRVSELSATVTEGLRLDEASKVGTNAIRIPLTVQADDPYWLSETRSTSFTGSAGTPWFSILPIQMGPSSILGNVTLNVDGDVPTNPIWTIVGPATDPVFTNNTTGEAFALVMSLQAGQRVIVDTRDYYKSVTGPDGSNWFSALTQRNLWALQPGTNNVNLFVSDSTNATYVGLYYRSRSLMP